MQIQWKLAIATALTAVVAGAASFFAANVAASKGASGTAALKASVGKFHNPDTAFDAGWQPQPGLDQCFELPGTGGMGIHYINTGLMDLTLDPTQPEAMVYQQDPNGRLHLGAVEYIVPQAPWDAAHPLDADGHRELPVLRGLTPEDLPLHLNAGLGVYVLHAWVFTKNPAGTFADWNPDVSCLPGTAAIHGHSD
ncbi:MAG TPA: hypothetical protein VFC53_09360 [Dehalococcoidia bacterium]|nr:hypothetical protein [Dehalococcoidia bacterium]